MAAKVQKTDIPDEELHPENYFKSPEGHPRDRIIIHESLDIPKEGLFLSLNGYSFLAKPGMEIDLPRPVRKMLDTRIKTETIQTDGVEHVRHIPRITYTLVQEGVNVPPALAAAPAPEVTAEFP